MTNSNEANPNDSQDRAFATLALGITAKNSESVMPATDDDLIAFCKNQLDEEPRAQVMHSIANDNDTYSRWLETIHAIELLEEFEREDAEVAATVSGAAQTVDSGLDASDQAEGPGAIKSWDLVGRLNSWLKKKHAGNGLFGRRYGVAIACAGVLSVLLAPQLFKSSAPGIDGLYEQYAAFDTASLLPTKSIQFPTEGEQLPYTVQETELAKGVVAGFEELEVSDLPLEWTVEPSLYLDSDIEPDRGEHSTYALGRLIALSLVQCKVAKESDYFESAAPLMRKLVGQHNTLATHLADTGSERGDVCGTASVIIKLI